MKLEFIVTDIRTTRGELLEGWKIKVLRSEFALEYSAELYYEDGMLYGVFEKNRDLSVLIHNIIDEIEWINNNIPKDALNSSQEWSHVRSFGNYGSRKFIMLCKCNGRATLSRFEETKAIFNKVQNYIPVSKEMLEKDWQGKVEPSKSAK